MHHGEHTLPLPGHNPKAGERALPLGQSSLCSGNHDISLTLQRAGLRPRVDAGCRLILREPMERDEVPSASPLNG
jgi:hypothetical protein